MINNNNTHTHITYEEAKRFADTDTEYFSAEDLNFFADFENRLNDCDHCLVYFDAYLYGSVFFDAIITEEEEFEPVIVKKEDEQLSPPIIRENPPLPSIITKYIQNAKNTAQNIMESLFVQPRFALVTDKGTIAKALSIDSKDNNEISIEYVGEGFFRFSLEEEKNVRIEDNDIFEIPAEIKENPKQCKLVIMRLQREEYNENEVGIRSFKIDPAQISFKDIRLPAGEYVFYLRMN